MAGKWSQSGVEFAWGFTLLAATNDVWFSVYVQVLVHRRASVSMWVMVIGQIIDDNINTRLALRLFFFEEHAI